jgi:hypothetical protein
MEFDQKASPASIECVDAADGFFPLLKVKSFSPFQRLRVCLFVRRLNKYLINPLGRKEGGQIVLHSRAENGPGATSLSLSISA